MIGWSSITCNICNIYCQYLLWILWNKLEQNKYCLNLHWCVKNDRIYRWSIMLKNEMWNLFKQWVFDNCLRHKKQEAIVVRTLSQLLQFLHSWDRVLKRHCWQLVRKLSIPVSRSEWAGTKTANGNASFINCNSRFKLLTYYTQ